MYAYLLNAVLIMIICPNAHPDYPNDWMLVKQSDHDDHSGYIASHMVSPRYWQPTDKRLLTVAVAMHDTGSASDEDHPLIHMDGEVGKPVSFWTVSPDEHLKLHRIGVKEAQQVHPYCALLISMHVVGIHRDRLHIDPAPNRWHIPHVSTPALEEFIAEQTALQVQLRREAEQCLGVTLTDERLMNDFKIFELIDIVSTQFSACGLADREMVYVPDAEGNPMTVNLRRRGEWEFQMTPFPFAGSRFDCPVMARRVRKQVFRNHAEFWAAWYAAPQVVLPYFCSA